MSHAAVYRCIQCYIVIVVVVGRFLFGGGLGIGSRCCLGRQVLLGGIFIGNGFANFGLDLGARIQDSQLGDDKDAPKGRVYGQIQPKICETAHLLASSVFAHHGGHILVQLDDGELF